MYMVRTITRLTNVMKTCWQKRKKNQMYTTMIIFHQRYFQRSSMYRFKGLSVWMKIQNHNDNWLCITTTKTTTTQLWWKKIWFKRMVEKCIIYLFIYSSRFNFLSTQNNWEGPQTMKCSIEFFVGLGFRVVCSSPPSMDLFTTFKFLWIQVGSVFTIMIHINLWMLYFLHNFFFGKLAHYVYIYIHTHTHNFFTNNKINVKID